MWRQWLDGVFRALTKFALSPGWKPAGLECMSPQENLWVACNISRLDNKCLCSAASHRWPCVYVVTGRGEWHLSVPLFPEKSSTYSEIGINSSPSCCASCLLCCLSARCCLFKAGDLAVTHLPGSPSAESADL